MLSVISAAECAKGGGRGYKFGIVYCLSFIFSDVGTVSWELFFSLTKIHTFSSAGLPNVANLQKINENYVKVNEMKKQEVKV